MRDKVAGEFSLETLEDIFNEEKIKEDLKNIKVGTILSKKLIYLLGLEIISSFGLNSEIYKKNNKRYLLTPYNGNLKVDLIYEI